MKLPFRIRGIMQTMVWLILATGFTMLLTSTFNISNDRECNQLQISMNQAQFPSFLSKADVYQILSNHLNVDSFNVAIGRLELDQLEELLTAHPYIKSAELYVDNQGKLDVKVEENKVILRIKDKDGNQYYISEDCSIVPLSSDYIPRVLIANGAITNLSEDQEMNQKLCGLARYIQQDAFWLAMAEQIYVEDDKVQIIPKVGEHVIQLGDTDFNQRLADLKVFYLDAMLYNDWREYKEINIEFNNQVVCVKNN